MKQIEVTILGQSYRLSCPEDGEAPLREAVASVDAEMSGIRDAGRVKARERIAVLAALNLAYRLAERPAAPDVDDRPARVSSNGASDAGVSDATIERLVRRIDAVLGEDGHLL